MYDPSFTPPDPLPPIDEPKKKAPIMGIIAMVTAIIAIIMVCIMFISIFVVGSNSGFDTRYIDQQSLASLGFGIIALLCIAGLCDVVGIVLGILSVVKEENKVFGIIGLVLNVLIILGVCGFLGFSFMSAA